LCATGFNQTFDHADNLEALEMCVSDLIQGEKKCRLHFIHQELIG